MQSLIGFIKDAYAEIMRVKFPSKKQTIRLTGFVIGVSLATGLYVTGLDYGFKELLKLILKA
jgi:preprotein translocase SecE subunit